MEEVTAHLDYSRALNAQLAESGEHDVTVLTPPDAAHLVRADASSGRVVTDSPFQEFKEWVAGFQVIDVDTEERGLEITALVSAVPVWAASRFSSRSTCAGSWTRGHPTPLRWMPGWGAQEAGVRADRALDGLEGPLGGHQRLHAVRGQVAELRGDRSSARRHYPSAAARATNLVEQRHLTRLAAGLAESPGSASG